MSNLLKLDYVQVYNGAPAMLSSFIAIIDALHKGNSIKTSADDFNFTAIIAHCKLSDVVKEKLVGIQVKKWAELKALLIQKFKPDSTRIHIMLAELSNFTINKGECLTELADRMLLKINEIKLACGVGYNVIQKYCEISAVEKLRTYCTTYGQLALGTPQSLEEAKNVLICKGLGFFKPLHQFETIEQKARREMCNSSVMHHYDVPRRFYLNNRLLYDHVPRYNYRYNKYRGSNNNYTNSHNDWNFNYPLFNPFASQDSINLFNHFYHLFYSYFCQYPFNPFVLQNSQPIFR